jgi:hypothetical protein
MDDLITWSPEPAAEDEWSLVGALNDDETYACHIAHQEALEAELRRERELSEKLDGLNAGQILQLYEKELAQQAKRSIPQQQEEAVRQFICEAPEFLLSKQNTDRVDQYFKASGLDATSPDHFHQAYKALSARGLIQTDESKRPRTPRKRITQEDLETMPLDQLAALANRR